MRPSSLPVLAAALLLNGCGRESAPRKLAAETVQSTGNTIPVSQPAKVSFNQHIQPILSEYCYHCHGPDSGTREPKKAPLRLDRPEDAFAARDGGKPVIIKGKPAESEIVKRMRSHDPETIMPPPRSHKEMDEASIALMERWIEQGAEYELHWSFIPVKRPESPRAGADRAANPIDGFIAAKLDEAGLAPNPPEDPRRFFRRLHLDLTGLPPAPEDVDHFVKDDQADPAKAVADAADRLLASMASAEHFARHWLDAARYGDTHGIHIDNYRSIWPYRDWVVKAFHRNMPWDQFTTEQLAGDLLPGRSDDQLIATGFNRCLATTGEGGAIPEEYDAVYAKDRVETMSAIWLGLTTGCAACHDHKFDPVSTKEFYSLTAFFRNSTMEALDKNLLDHPPNLVIPRDEDRARWNAVRREISEIRKQIADRAKEAEEDLQAWIQRAAPPSPADADPFLALHLPLNDASGPLKGTIGRTSHEWPFTGPRSEGPWGKAPVFNGTPLDLGDLAIVGDRAHASFGMLLKIDAGFEGTVISRTGGDPQKEVGWAFEIEEGVPVLRTFYPENRVDQSVKGRKPLGTGEWIQVFFSHQGTIAFDSPFRLYLNGKPHLPFPPGEETVLPPPGPDGGRLVIGARSGGKPAKGWFSIQDLRFHDRVITPEEVLTMAESHRSRSILRTPRGKRSKEQTDVLRRQYFSSVDPVSSGLKVRLAKLIDEQARIRDRGAITLVMDDKKTEPFAHVLIRGVYTAKGERVAPETPKVLPPMAADAPRNRLGLAHWLNDPANPLPARVTMNRLWHQIFGTGIVDSNGDFGIMGSRPSHPELLDWLAAEFMESKWNHRHMVKLMVTSATYRQSAKVTPEKLEKDPANRLLWRGPRIRLDAEPIRDLALAASGLLSTKVGGPPVKPYQPEKIWESVAMPSSNTRVYIRDVGESLHRRSLYSLWKRTAIPSTMEVFDAPSRDVFCVRRDRTNTPLQALALMNDPQFIEASRELAARAMNTSPDTDARIDFMMRRLLARTASKDERRDLYASLETLRNIYRSTPDDATALLQTGAKPPPADLDPTELAAWTMIASQLLNLDETITR
jgi:hypothetical protein